MQTATADLLYTQQFIGTAPAISFRMEEEKAMLQETKIDSIAESTPILKQVEGKVAVPILLWFMGVPGFIVILLWAFFFRG